MTPGRSAGRRRRLALLPVGIGGVACVACCTLPLWIAGGLTLTGSAVALDTCVDTWLPALLLAGFVVVATILLAGSIRRRRRTTNGADQACDCGPSDTQATLPTPGHRPSA